MSVLIAKADGTMEPFEPQKLVSSLLHAGADPTAATAIATDIEKTLKSGATTGEIYRQAFVRLRQERRTSAARYSLKRAILDFGPSGFPFEAYLAELFRAEGWSAKVGQIVEGKCVEHEVDVVLEKNNESVFVEAKFHNEAGFKTDLKTVLYVQARIEDINLGRGMVVTNTKFTSKAIQYASCRGLELLAWEYPSGKSLHDRIDKAGLYPVTALTSLTRREKTALLNDRVVLCRALPDNTKMLSELGISGSRSEEVLEEVAGLCVPGKGV